MSNEDESLKEDCSSLNEGEAKYNNGRWSNEEHQSFIEGVLEYGTNWNKLTEIIPSRSTQQLKSHSRKCINQLGNKSTTNGDNNHAIDKSFTKEEIAKLSNIVDITAEAEVDSDRKKSCSIEKSQKKDELQKDNKPENQIENNTNDNITNTNDNKKNMLENIFEASSSAGTNFLKMEELKKMSEVLHILNRTTSESTSSQTSNNSNPIGHKMLRSYLKKTRNGLKKVNKPETTTKRIENENSRASRRILIQTNKQKRRKKSKPKPLAITQSKSNDSLKAPTETNNMDNLPTEKIYELFKLMNPPSSSNNSMNLLEAPHSQLRFYMNLNNIINNNNFNNGFQEQSQIQQQQIQQQLEQLNQYQQLHQIQLLELQQQQMNRRTNIAQLYNGYHQSSPYYHLNHNQNNNDSLYSNQMQNSLYYPNYPNRNYVNQQQGLFQSSQFPLLENSLQNQLNPLAYFIFNNETKK